MTAMTVECRRCQKAITIQEWCLHVDWHRADDEWLTLIEQAHDLMEGATASGDGAGRWAATRAAPST
jgi:hypothetical protein